MWFRNLQVFRLTPAWSFSADVLSEKLTTGIFQPCGATDRVARGWVPPRGQEGELVYKHMGLEMKVKDEQRNLFF